MSTECWFRLLDDTKAQRNMCNNEKCNFPISLETPHGKHPTSIRSIDFKLACLPTGKGVKSIVNVATWVNGKQFRATSPIFLPDSL